MFLTINRARARDEGYYFCKADNGELQRFSSMANLEFRDPPSNNPPGPDEDDIPGPSKSIILLNYLGVLIRGLKVIVFYTALQTVNYVTVNQFL